ncbi:Hypothetical protein POVR2_LOCUS51 [uncultured virus]|nr:Hypothetical protein POVR2_LOCUS51 [uncultured virus]
MLKYIQDPSIVLRRAVRYEYVDIVKLIVSDPRTVKYVDRDLLVGCVAIREVDIQNTEIATLLERLKEAYFAR